MVLSYSSSCYARVILCPPMHRKTNHNIAHNQQKNWSHLSYIFNRQRTLQEKFTIITKQIHSPSLFLLQTFENIHFTFKLHSVHLANKYHHVVTFHFQYKYVFYIYPIHSSHSYSSSTAPHA